MDAEKVYARLAGQLPQAVMLMGSGGWELGQRLWQLHGGPHGQVIARLGADEARMVRDLAWVLPPKGNRVFLIGLDKASAQAQNILLKVLEEPPGSVRFLLAAGSPPLRTVISRCQVFPVGALAAGADDEPARAQATVGTAVRAARDGHAAVLEAALRGWEPACTAVLRAWAAGAAAGCWRAYSTDFAPGVTAKQALALLSVLGTYEGARTAPAVALERAFRR